MHSDPLAKNIMQGIFDDHIKLMGESSDGYGDEDEFLKIKGDVLFSKEFWTYYSNLELVHKKMKKLKKCCVQDKDDFDDFCKLFSKPYSKQMLELSFEVVNSEVFDRLDKKCFFACDDEDNKTYFDDKKSVLYVQGVKVKISKQDKITNAHKLLHHIFITNKDNLKDDFYYAEIAEDEFYDLDYTKDKNNWKRYHNICFELSKKIEKETKHKDFLKFNTGRKGKVKLNKKYL
ncbi:MAG: hypothetical protein ABIH87_03340 [bacterium]